MARYKVTDTKEARALLAEKEDVFAKIKVGIYGAAIATTIIAAPGTMKIAMWAAALGYNAIIKHRETSPFCAKVADGIYNIFKKCQNVNDGLENYNTNKFEKTYFPGTDAQRKKEAEEKEEQKWRDYAETRRILDEMKAQKEQEVATRQARQTNIVNTTKYPSARENDIATEEFLRRVNAIQNEDYQVKKNNEGRHL